MERINKIKNLDYVSIEKSQLKWNNVAKPLHSLGMLEEAIIKIAGIVGSENVILDKRCIIDVCSDNGVVEEGVTQTDSIVTSIVAESMANGNSNINNMAKIFNTEVITVDVGIKYDIDKKLNILNKKISYGTKNITKGPAMTMSQAEKAVLVGIDLVKKCKEDNYKIIVTGEMGIGNTTTSSAIASVLLDLPVESVTGKGAGLNSDGLEKKINAIKKAIKINVPNKENPIELISKLGGYDIAAMVGIYLGGAIYNIPIVIDGFISAVSAALAISINPLSKNYMFASHVSKEPAGLMMLNFIGLKPFITAEMCLGEGTGGVLLLPILDAALSVYNSSHIFDALPMEKYEEFV